MLYYLSDFYLNFTSNSTREFFFICLCQQVLSLCSSWMAIKRKIHALLWKILRNSSRNSDQYYIVLWFYICITLKCICLLFPEIKICQPPKSNSIKELSVAKSTCPGKQCPGGCCNVDWWYCCKGGRFCASHPGLCHKKTPSESKIY